MFRDRAQALCDPIAEEIREEIRRDRRRVKATNVAKLLREIEEDLLDPNLTIEALRRRCGIHDKNVSTIFNRPTLRARRDSPPWRRPASKRSRTGSGATCRPVRRHPRRQRVSPPRRPVGRVSLVIP